MPDRTSLRSFFMAGFEASAHKRPDGVRLDLIAGTEHDRLAERDYRRCAELGLQTIRDGVRWHLVEAAPGRRDWSSWTPMLEAAERAGVEVIWDMLHYGCPDHLGPDHPDFVEAFARFAADALRIRREFTDTPALVCPVNEISYWTWAVNTGYFAAAGPDEPGWFKRRLVSAGIAAAKAMRSVDPQVRFVWAEPLMHVAGRRDEPDPLGLEQNRLGQFEAVDMLTGAKAPELGGAPDLVDYVGLNYYPDNQSYFQGSTIPLGHFAYRPLADLLGEVAGRYGKPMLLTETGAEGSARTAWLHYVGSEVREAIASGVPVEGICLYPIASYPGWDDGRFAPVGLFSAPDANGERETDRVVASELERQRGLFASGPA